LVKKMKKLALALAAVGVFTLGNLGAPASASVETYEAKAEYAIWAYASGDRGTSRRLQAELDRIAARWNGLTRELNEPVQHRLQAARDLASRQA
jgi:hypothetical protein